MERGNGSPLVIFGFDGGDPELLLQWANEGHLPSLASILKRGCWSAITGPEMISEHAVWIPMFSGISRGRLGLYYFRQLKPHTYELQLVTGMDVHAPPFWSHLINQNKRILVMDVPEVYPVRDLEGFQISNWAPHHAGESRHAAFLPSAEPKNLLQEIPDRFAACDSLPEKWNSTLQEDRDLFRLIMERIKKKSEFCRYLLGRGSFDLIVIIFTESHLAGHQFWKYRKEHSHLQNAIREIYQAIDREIGVLLEQLPADSNIAVISNVGMEDIYPTIGITDAFCRELGYQPAAGPAPFSLQPMKLARRFIPESWRIGMSRLLPRDTREKLLSEQFRNTTNWQEASAFTIPVFYNGLIRVNLRDREPSGTISGGAEYESILNRLEDDLRKLIDPHTGEPAVKELFRPGKLYGMDPPEVFPDLWIHWRPASHFLDRVLHPKTELHQKPGEFLRSSDHSHEGFFSAAGPSIRQRGQIQNISLLDLAPSFLKLLRAEIPESMTGKPRFGKI